MPLRKSEFVRNDLHGGKERTLLSRHVRALDGHRRVEIGGWGSGLGFRYTLYISCSIKWNVSLRLLIVLDASTVELRS